MNEKEKISLFGKTLLSLIMIGIVGFIPAIGIKVVTFAFGKQLGFWWPCYGIGFIIVTIITILAWINVSMKKRDLQHDH